MLDVPALLRNITVQLHVAVLGRCCKLEEHNCAAASPKTVSLSAKSLAKMHFYYWFTLLAAVTIAQHEPQIAPRSELFTIELAPGETRDVTEAEKFALKHVCIGVLSNMLTARRLQCDSKVLISSTSPNGLKLRGFLKVPWQPPTQHILPNVMRSRSFRRT